MSTRLFLGLLVLTAVIAFGVVGVLVTVVHPSHAGTGQFFFLYIALFLGTASLAATAAFFTLRSIGRPSKVLEKDALRQGVLVAVVLVILLIMQAHRYLSLPLGAAVVAVVGLIELYGTASTQH